MDAVWDNITWFCEVLQGDNVAFLVLLVSSFPSALFMKYLGSPTSKQTFSIILALLQTWFICKGDIIIPILLSVLSYIALRIIPKRLIGRITFHLTFSFLLVFKLLVFSDIFIPSYLTDAVVLLMVLRIVSYGYDYQLDKVFEDDNKDTKPSQACSLFDFLGYCFCFVGYWTGPFYNFRTYHNMLHSKTLIRSSKLALWHMRYMLVLLPLHMLQNALIPLDYVMEEEFLERSFLYKFIYQFLGFWTFKVKFYGGWIMAEGICIACNLGTVESDDGTVDYSSIVNIDIYNTEVQWELANCVRAWNKSVQRWMKTYVYDTTTLPKSIRTDFVFGISAFWHGVRPGYYLTFFSAPPMMKLQQKVGNLTREYRANHPAAEMVYRVVNWWFVRLMSCVFFLPFYMLELERILAVWASMFWTPWIAISVVILLGVFLPTGPRPDKPKSS